MTSVPMHGGKDIGRGLLTKILKQAGLSVKEFLKLVGIIFRRQRYGGTYTMR